MRFLTYCAMVTIIIVSCLYIYKDKIFPRSQSIAPYVPREAPKTVRIAPEPDWFSVQKAIGNAVTASRNAAMESAKSYLSNWHKERMLHIDNDFLDWYFGYWNMQARNIGTAWDYIWEGEEVAAADLERRINQELVNRGLHPDYIDRAITNAAESAGRTFSRELQERFENIRTEFSIPAVKWEEYLEKIKIITAQDTLSTGGQYVEEVSAKALFVAGGVTGIKAVSIAAVKLASVKAASIAAAKSASVKGVALLAAKAAAAKGGVAAGSSLGGPILAAAVVSGIAIWEWWDHSDMVEEEKPKLRQKIENQLLAFEEDMLREDGAIGAVFIEIEQSIFESAQNATLEMRGD